MTPFLLRNGLRDRQHWTWRREDDTNNNNNNNIIIIIAKMNTVHARHCVKYISNANHCGWRWELSYNYYYISLLI